VFSVGEVGLQYRVLPEGVEVDLEDLKKKIQGALPAGAALRASETKPLAFGLQALHVLVVLDDKKGGAEQVEAAIGAVPGVQSVEIVQMGLL
jgi:elongation factor 1-beta